MNKKPLKREHIKPRLLGHWGTTPGLNFVYVHLNRAIKAHDLNVIYIAGPGHGGPSGPGDVPGDAAPRGLFDGLACGRPGVCVWRRIGDRILLGIGVRFRIGLDGGVMALNT